MRMALALAAATVLFVDQALAAETDKAQTIIWNGEQTARKGSERFF